MWYDILGEMALFCADATTCANSANYRQNVFIKTDLKFCTSLDKQLLQNTHES